MAAEQGHSVANTFVQRLSEIEELAEEIMQEKQQIRDLDNKRNTNREAITAIKQIKEKDVNKSWFCLGGVFIKYPTNNISELLKKDQEEVNSEMEGIRNELKSKVAKLHQLEGKVPPEGFHLTAVGQDELSAFTVQK